MQRQARLAGAAGAGQSQEAHVAVEQALQFRQLFIAPDEVGEMNGEIVRRTGCCSLGRAGGNPPFGRFRRTRRRLQQPQRLGAAHCLALALNVQLAVQVLDVTFNRADRQCQTLRDFRRGETLGQQAQNLAFAASERLSQLAILIAHHEPPIGAGVTHHYTIFSKSG